MSSARCLRLPVPAAPRGRELRFIPSVPLATVPLLLVLALTAACSAGLEDVPAAAITAVEVSFNRAFGGLEFDQPVALIFEKDSAARAFVVEQPGRIVRVTQTGGSWKAEDFLEIADRVNDRGNEEGLLGLALHPDFPSSGYLFVYYTAAEPRRSVLSRFTIDPKNSSSADIRSELVLLEVAQPYSNHNGGQIVFGPDGYLYVGLGDGGGGGDPRRNGQNRGTLLGSILRIDVSTVGESGVYTTPADNPLVGTNGARGEVWAYGLRNPWRFTFDRLTGYLWAADVGQNAREEVDVIRPGLNYGWNVMEGSECFARRGPTCNREGMKLPIVEYTHSDGCSITGGYVYRGSRISALVGKYVYGDFCSGKIWAFYHETGANVEIADTRLKISSFGEDASGEMYVVSLDGGVYKIVSE